MDACAPRLMPDLGRSETAGAMTAQTQEHAIEAWQVPVCGLQLAGDAFGLGASLTPGLPSTLTPLVSAIVLSY
jgi:hypothetical protein